MQPCLLYAQSAHIDDLLSRGNDLIMSMLPCRGFTRFSRDDYIQWKKEGRLVNDGVNAKVGHCACWLCCQ